VRDTVYIEAPNGRLYEAVEVPGFPAGDHGPSLCVFDDDEQRIGISDTVPFEEWPDLIAGYFNQSAPELSWKLVPLMGRVA
jgi:hypothetical protein